MPYCAKIELSVVTQVVLAKNAAWCMLRLGGIWADAGDSLVGIGWAYNQRFSKFYLLADKKTKVMVSDYATPDGVSDDSENLVFAINAAMNAGKPLVFDKTSVPYVIAGESSIKVLANKKLTIEGRGATIKLRQRNKTAFRFFPETLERSQSGTATENSITLDSVSGVSIGDLVYLNSSCIVESNWKYTDKDVRKVVAKSGLSLTLSEPLNFERTEKSSQYWTAPSTGEQVFWYSYAGNYETECLINDVITSHSVRPRHSGDGVDVVVNCNAGDSVEVRKTQPSNITVFKPCEIKIDGLNILFDEADNCRAMLFTGISNAELTDISYVDSNSSQVNDGSTFAACHSPRVFGQLDCSMRYAVSMTHGTHGGDVRDVFTDSSRHAVSFSQFASCCTASQVSGSSDYSVCDVHPSFNCNAVDCTFAGAGTINNRGDGGLLKRCERVSAVDESTSHGISWLNNSAINSPFALAKEKDYEISDSNLPMVSFGFAAKGSLSVRSTTLTQVSGSNSAGSSRPKAITIDQCDLGRLLFRFAGKVTVQNSRVGFVDFFGTFSDWRDVVFAEVIFSEPIPIRRVGANNGRAIEFNKCTFENGMDGDLISSVPQSASNPCKIKFIDCIFDGFRQVGERNNAILEFVRCGL